jgi:hypothetical protein
MPRPNYSFSQSPFIPGVSESRHTYGIASEKLIDGEWVRVGSWQSFDDKAAKKHAVRFGGEVRFLKRGVVVARFLEGERQ